MQNFLECNELSKVDMPFNIKAGKTSQVYVNLGGGEVRYHWLREIFDVDHPFLVDLEVVVLKEE